MPAVNVPVAGPRKLTLGHPRERATPNCPRRLIINATRSLRQTKLFGARPGRATDFRAGRADRPRQQARAIVTRWCNRKLRKASSSRVYDPVSVKPPRMPDELVPDLVKERDFVSAVAYDRAGHRRNRGSRIELRSTVRASRLPFCIASLNVESGVFRRPQGVRAVNCKPWLRKLFSSFQYQGFELRRRVGARVDVRVLPLRRRGSAVGVSRPLPR